MVGPERIGHWVEMLKDEYGKEPGNLSVETAKNLLVLCACVESAVTGFLIKHETQGVIESMAPIHKKGRSDA
jgi:hypothetical protein